MRRALVVAATILVPGTAQAHLVGVEFGAFYAGALHLTVGVDYVALLLAVALLAALQDRARARWVLAALPLGLLAGVAIGVTGLVPADLVALERPTIAVGLVIVGGLGLAALRVPTVALVALSGAAGLLIGAANGIALQDAALDPVLYAAGIAVAGTVLITLLLAGATALSAMRDWLRLGNRVASSWLATLGVLLVGLGLSGQI